MIYADEKVIYGGGRLARKVLNMPSSASSSPNPSVERRASNRKLPYLFAKDDKSLAKAGTPVRVSNWGPCWHLSSI